MSGTDKTTLFLNVPGVDINDKTYKTLPFGRRIDFMKKFEAFKTLPGVKMAYVSQKRQTAAKGIKEFKGIYEPKAFFMCFFDKKLSPGYYDDSFEVWYIPGVNNETLPQVP